MGVRQQVKEVSDVARSNIQKVMDRGDRLDDLQARADMLAGSAVEFQTSSNRLKRKLFYQNVKGTCGLCPPPLLH
eukprot:Em0008g412a